MNISGSTVRGFFEILMPGMFLLLNITFTIYLFAVVFTPEILPMLNAAVKYFANPAFAISLLVIFGYPVGVVLRLYKNAKIDERSAKHIVRFKVSERDKLYIKDNFFYCNWMREKCKSRMPEALEFFNKFWGNKDTGNGQKNTTFFNFCKTVVAKHDSNSANEIFAAEALGRFVAGSYYALRFSVFLMAINAFCIYIKFSLRAVLLPFFFVIFYLYLLHVILSQYRLLRCKEVDTVFNACYANRDHFEKLCFPCSDSLSTDQTNVEKYNVRKNILLEVWREYNLKSGKKQAIDLQHLIDIMKEKSQIHPYLSSIYFAGSDVDHPFFLKNTKVAFGIAILPEDNEKAGIPKRHPRQIEIIIVIKGSLSLLYDQDDQIKEQIIKENECFVIDKGICHWITSVDEGDAAYIFIKTNPSEEPRSYLCLEKKVNESKR